MIHKKFRPSTDLWVCEHGVSYPDVCKDCQAAKEAAGVTTRSGFTFYDQR